MLVSIGDADFVETAGKVYIGVEIGFGKLVEHGVNAGQGALILDGDTIERFVVDDHT